MTKPAITVSGEDNIQPTRCPTCGAAIEMHATVEAWLEPRDWHFYGYVGQRWVKCKGTHGDFAFTHFMALVNRRQSHRIAWVKATTSVVAAQPALL